MQTEIVFETLCSEVLEALRNIGLGDHSIRNYYYEGMWLHSAALNGSWCGGKQQLSAANGRGISKDFPRQW